MTRKIVQSIEQQLLIARARIGNLETENQQLKTENRDLKLALRKKSPAVQNRVLRPRPVSASSDSGYSSGSQSSPSEDTPSYARPTRASRLRDAQPPAPHNQSTSSVDAACSSSTSSKSSSGGFTPREANIMIHGKAYIYQRGHLATPWSQKRYLKSTKASVSKFGWLETLRSENYSCPAQNFWSYQDDGALETVPTPPPEPRIVLELPPTQNMSQTELDDIAEVVGIVQRTRLYDNAWLADPANNIRMDHDEAFGFLARAEKLAKQCLLRWLRANRPQRCKQLGLYYLSDMDLGRQVLQNLTRHEEGDEFYNHRQTGALDVLRSIEQMIQLRNRVHHFNGAELSVVAINRYLCEVHVLAIKLYDEESAKRARDMRDQLHRAAQGVAREIEAVRFLTPLPFAGEHPWSHHHTELFALVAERSIHEGEKVRHLYSPLVIELAQEWKKDGGQDWSLEPNSEVSLEIV